MQDGAPPHCTREAKQFLTEKFQGRVISIAAQELVYTERPQSIQYLIECMKLFAAIYDAATIDEEGEGDEERLEARKTLSTG